MINFCIEIGAFYCSILITTGTAIQNYIFESTQLSATNGGRMLHPSTTKQYTNKYDHCCNLTRYTDKDDGESENEVATTSINFLTANA